MHGIILVYDITNEMSFKNLRNWNRIIEEKANKNVIKILVGNKCDLNNRVISKEEGEKFASDYNYIFFETSNKNNINVNEVFYCMIKKILKAIDEKKLIIKNPKNYNKNKCLLI